METKTRLMEICKDLAELDIKRGCLALYADNVVEFGNELMDRFIGEKKFATRTEHTDAEVLVDETFASIEEVIGEFIKESIKEIETDMDALKAEAAKLVEEARTKAERAKTAAENAENAAKTAEEVAASASASFAELTALGAKIGIAD